MFPLKRNQIHRAEHIAHKDAQRLNLSVGANLLQISRGSARRAQRDQMPLDTDAAIELAGTRHLFQQLRAANKEIARVSTGLECLRQQFEQPRIGDQQFEKQTAHAVGFDEAEKLREREIRIDAEREPFEQHGSQFPKNLARARSDVKTAAALSQFGERFCGCRLIRKNFKPRCACFRILWPGRDDAFENLADPTGVAMEGGEKVFRRRKSQAESETVQCFRFLRNAVGLLFGFDLEAMFYAPQETVGTFEIDRFARGSSSNSANAGNVFRVLVSWRKACRAPCNSCSAWTTNSISRIPPRPELHVSIQIFVSDDVAFDSSFDRRDLVQQFRRRTLRDK